MGNGPKVKGQATKRPVASAAPVAVPVEVPAPERVATVEPLPPERDNLLKKLKDFLSGSGDPHVHRNPAAMVFGWNKTTAEALRENLSKSPIRDMLKLPTMRELLGMEAKQYGPLSESMQSALADMYKVNGVTAVADPDKFAEDNGLAEAPLYSSPKLRQQSGSNIKQLEPFVKQGIDAVNEMGGFTPRVAMMLDAMAGLVALKGRNYEVLITAGGSKGSPKGAALAEANKKITEYMRTLAQEINREMGYDTTVRKDGLLSNKDTPGYRVYNAIATDGGTRVFRRANDVLASLEQSGQMGSIQVNNN